MALDNQDARSYVNRVCMSLKIPLIEAGSLGYMGQAYSIIQGFSRCYDCFEKPIDQKSYPACTIRTLPEKPVHCIIWAKFLFGILFGPTDEGESNLLEDLRAKFASNSEGPEDALRSAQLLFDQLFCQDIINSLETAEHKEKFAHVRPVKTVNLSELPRGGLFENNTLQFLQSTHSVEEYAQMFRDSFTYLNKLKQQSQGSISFDKDNSYIMKFIASACNIRCHIFGLDLQNEFTVKQISGNVIPAIASTNAIVAALQVTEAVKVFKKKADPSTKLKELWVQNDYNKKINEQNYTKPNELCIACQDKVLPDIIECNFREATLQDFFQQAAFKK